MAIHSFASCSFIVALVFLIICKGMDQLTVSTSFHRLIHHYISLEFVEVHSLLKTGVITWYGQGYYQVPVAPHWIAPGSNLSRASHAPFKPRPAGQVDFGVEPVAPSMKLVKEVVQPGTVGPTTCHAMGVGRPHPRP